MTLRLTVVALCLWMPAALGAPKAVIAETVDSVVAVLKKDDQAAAHKRAQVEALIDARFDYAAMSRRILGPSWQQANVEQQARFVALFRQILSNTYWDRVEAYKDERIEYLHEEIKQEKYAKVDTVIHTASADIPVDYKLFLSDGDWKVYDVVIEQVSLIRNYRSSYGEIVKNEGIEGLLMRMETKAGEI